MFGLRCRDWRKNLLLLCIGIVSVAAAAFAADTAADLVFGKVHAEIAADIADFRGVACMESVERTRYAPRRPNRNGTCGELLAAVAGAPQGSVEWRSRLRLNVTAGASAEEFALTDASPFERNDVGGMLGSATAGSGEFSTFLRNLIASDGAPFQSRGLQQTPLGKLLSFGFTVPVEKSHFGWGGNGAIHIAYRGSLLTTESGELKQLAIEAENAGDACRVQYTTDYTNTRIGDREIVLPQSSTLEVISKNGTELRSETYYSGCRRPVAVAAAPAAPGGNAPKPLPSKVRFRVRFQPPIDSSTAATGDPVIGVVRATVKDRQNGIIVHVGDRLHGRIASIEETFSPQPRWNIAIAFETIERGVGEHGIDQGVEQPVSLVPIDDGDRVPHDEATGPGDLQMMRPPGGGYFIFHDPEVVLDQKFETEWETR